MVSNLVLHTIDCKMTALQRSVMAFRRVAGSSQRRGFASHHEPQVTWSEYRSGKKSLTEWVDGNRAQVAFGFFVFYSSLAAWTLRPKKKATEPEANKTEREVATPPSA